MLVIFVAWSTLVAGQQRQHLLRSLATFSVAKGSVFAEEDRATIEAAIQEWYGGAEAGAGGEDGKGDAGGGGEAGAGGGSKGGAKRDGIAKFEQELHEGKVHAAVHAALGGVSGFSLSDLLVAALPMYLDLLDYAFVNPRGCGAAAGRARRRLDGDDRLLRDGPCVRLPAHGARAAAGARIARYGQVRCTK